MEIHNLNEYTRGWFVGPFDPSCCKTDQAEVAVKTYKAGDKEAAHVHKIATEITVILSGSVRMNDTYLLPGAVVIVQPGEAVEFEALEDSSNVVVKVPAVPGDKYLV